MLILKIVLHTIQELTLLGLEITKMNPIAITVTCTVPYITIEQKTFQKPNLDFFLCSCGFSFLIPRNITKPSWGN